MGRWIYDDDDEGYFPRRRERTKVEVPSGLDPLRIMEFMDRAQRRAEKAKAKDPKKDENDPVKKYFEKKLNAGKNLLWYFQAACILYFLSPFIAAMQHIIENMATTLIK